MALRKNIRAISYDSLHDINGFCTMAWLFSKLTAQEFRFISAAKYYPQKYFLIYLWPQKCLCFCDPRIQGRAWGPDSTSKNVLKADTHLFRSEWQWGRIYSLFSCIFYSALSSSLLCYTLTQKSWHPHIIIPRHK